MMKQVLFGKSGLRVSEICLGAMTFGEAWDWGASREESRRIFDSFVAAGGNFIDTANRYTDGQSEEFTGEFVASDRGRFVVATKYSLSTQADDPNAQGNHRKNMVQALEASLRRLKTDYVDVYWLHAWDGMTPPEEVMRALDDLVGAGKVLYIGVSDTPAWRVSQMNMLAELRGWTAFTGLQIEYSLIQRTVEREYLPMARALDLALTAWAPLGGGVLTGKYTRVGDKVEATDSKRVQIMVKRTSDRNLAIAAIVREIAEARGVTPAQVALNWVRQQAGVVIPIVGARTEAQMRDSLGALEFELSSDELTRLDDASRVELGFPHDFLASDQIRQVIFGDQFDRIRCHRPRW
jgi:aryl-alcohol dehydrogenase-like predicted oxidoreductase